MTGKARVAIPITVPFLLGNHWPTMVLTKKVAPTMEKSTERPQTINQTA